MKPLTLEYLVENKMSYYDLIRYFNPRYSDNECDFYLWEHTSFPFSPIEQLIKELNNKFISE